MKRMMMVFVFALCTIPMLAQFQHTRTPNDTLQTVRNLGGGRVAFSIYAPNAKTVGFGGDAMPWGQKLNFTRNDDGVWTVVVPGVKTGVYRYNFVVDGVTVQDPLAVGVIENSALADIGSGKEFFDMRTDIPHGAMAERYYYSKTLKTMRRMHIWTPVGYEKSSEKLPVLYLIHGGGDNDASWPGVGCAGNILDNLMAEGKMNPMVVVMPNGSINSKDIGGEVPLFEKDLMTDIIPTVEGNYRVYTDPAHRAISGLSMGGMETLQALLDDTEAFDYYWVLSSGWWYDAKTYPTYQKKLYDVAKKLGHVKQLVFTMGGEEDIAYKNCQQMLKLFDKANIKYEYKDATGGHTWYTWRNNLYDEAQRLFK